MSKVYPLISVVIPVYNVEKYLNDCLESIINQTYKNIEIITVNDKSLDNSLSILEDYAKKDNRIKIINNKKNSGLSVSRNVGIENSEGEYITFIDSDDWIDKNYIKILYDIFQETNTNLCMPIFSLYNNKYKYYYVDGYYNNEFFQPNKNYIIKKSHIYDCLSMFNVHVAKLFKTAIVKENNISFPDGLCFEDNLFTLKYLLSDKNPSISITANAIYYYRTHVGGITSVSKNFRDIIKINKLVKDLFIEKGEYKQYYNSLNYYFCNHIYYWGLITRSNQINRDLGYYKLSNEFINKEIDNNYIENQLKKDNYKLYKIIKSIKENYHSFYKKITLKYYLKKVTNNVFIKHCTLIIKHSLKIIFFLLFKFPFRVYKILK